MAVSIKLIDCSNISALNRDKKKRRFFKSVLSFNQRADKILRILQQEQKPSHTKQNLIIDCDLFLACITMPPQGYHDQCFSIIFQIILPQYTSKSMPPLLCLNLKSKGKWKNEIVTPNHELHVHTGNSMFCQQTNKCV